MSGTHAFRTVTRVRWCRPGASGWKGSRIFVVRFYADQFARKMRRNGFVVQVSVAEIGPWRVLS